MNHMFSVSEQQYTKLMVYARQHEQTPETLFQAWVNKVVQRVEKGTDNDPLFQIAGMFAIGDADLNVVGQRVEKGTDNDPLFQIAGMFAIGDADLAAKHDKYLAEIYRDEHANN
jgi:hypothetical protein